MAATSPSPASASVAADRSLNRSQQNTTALPTPRSVNVLYLIVLLLLVTAGMIMQQASPLWGLLGTEVFVILIPALVYLRIRRLPVAQTLRLNWPGARLALLSVVLGACVWMFDAWFSGVISGLLGYSMSQGPDFLPDTPLKAVLLLTALVVAAPICEEILFRGVIQRAYERRPWQAIVLVGVIFVAYHLTFAGFAPLLPVAFVLGFVAWRSNSLISSMLVHAANNLFAGLLLVTTIYRPELLGSVRTTGPTPLMALIGLVVTVAGLFLFARWTSPKAQEIAPARSSWLATYWPLSIAAVVFAVFTGLELLVGLFPQSLAVLPLELPAVTWEEPVTWKYEIRNPAGAPVGKAECLVTHDSEEALLNCEMQNQPFELTQGRSYYKAERGFQKNIVDWNTTDRALLEAGLLRSEGAISISTVVLPGEDGLSMQVTYADKVETLALPENALLEGEWPWRLAGKTFSLGEIRKVQLAHPLKWDSATQANAPTVEETYLQVVGADLVDTPAGNFKTWRVKLGSDETAWYLTDAPYTLVRYKNNMLDYVLTEVQ